MSKVKVIDIDKVHNSVIAKIWDETLKKSIDEYPAVAVDVSLIDFSKNIEEQLCRLLEGQLQYQRNLETDIPQDKIEVLQTLINKNIEVEEIDLPLEGDQLKEQELYKSNWENGV